MNCVATDEELSFRAKVELFSIPTVPNISNVYDCKQDKIFTLEAKDLIMSQWYGIELRKSFCRDLYLHKKHKLDDLVC